MTFIFKGDIENNNEALEFHSKDASVFKILPTAVYYPKDVEDIQNLVKQVSEEKKTNPEASLSVRAGGTCMSGGSLNSGYMLNMTRHMNKVEVDAENLTAVVEMGAYFRDIESEAGKHGLMFAPYTSSKQICGIGGMIGNNASGEKSVRFGATIDNVLELEVVLADGSVIKTSPQDISDISDDKSKQIYDLFVQNGEALKKAVGDVPKAASGYRLERTVKNNIFDLMPIFVGAQGTLGIITKAKLKLTPLPTSTRLLVISIDSIHEMPFILKTIMKHNPEGVETFDVNTYKRAAAHMLEDGEKVAKFFHPTTTCVILAQFGESDQPTTDKVAKECFDALHADHNVSVEWTEDEEIALAIWRIRRVSYGVMRDYNEEGFKAVPCIEDVIVPIANFDVFVSGLVDLLAKYDLKYGFHGHIGDGALRVIPVFDFRDPNVADKIINFSREAFVLIKSVRGNTSADHGDGIIRSPFLKEFYGPELYEVFVKIKNIFDPENIFNPHKKVNGGEERVRKYLDR